MGKQIVEKCLYPPQRVFPCVWYSVATNSEFLANFKHKKARVRKPDAGLENVGPKTARWTQAALDAATVSCAPKRFSMDA